MMKSSFLSSSAVAIAAIMAFSISQVQAKVTLTYATNTAPTGLRGIAEKMFVDEIEKRTKGEVQIKAFWGESLLKGSEILKGVQDGVADMGHINSNYYPNRLLLNSAINLFLQGPVAYENKIGVYHRIYDEVPELTGEFDKYKQKIVYIYAVNPFAGTFITPFNSLADFKGRRVRASSRWYLALLEGLGATPVSIPWGDCYMALQTKTVDGVFTNGDAINRVKLDEVAPNLYYFEEMWVPTPYLVTINTKKWNGLSEDVRKAIQAAAAETEKAFGAAYKTMYDDIIAAQKKLGYVVKFATKDEIATVMQLPAVEQNKQTWIKEATKLGASDAEAVLKKIDKVIADGIAKEK